MFVDRISKPVFVASLLVASACGGSGGSDTVALDPDRTAGGTIAHAAPTVAPTAAPTEESPGVYTGVVSCNHPNVIEFAGAASEVISIEGLVESTGESGNPTITLLEGADVVIESGNPVDISGAAFPENPVNGRRTYNLRHSASYSLRVSVEQCGSFRYRVAISRDVAPSANLTREAAEAITVGTPVRGTLGCEEHRYYGLDVTRRTTFHVSVGGAGRLEGGSGELSVALLGADGAPVMASGNPIAAAGSIANPAGEPTTSNITVARAGHYVLDVSFPASCTIADYEVTVAR